MHYSPFKKEIIYAKYLADISEIKFTSRQLDVLACLIHKRNYGKITDLLRIDSNRTVPTHITNIKGKMQGMSVESIIDFIDRSGKRQYLVESYFQILIEDCFYSKLKQIKNTIIRQPIRCKLVGILDKNIQNILQNALKQANIILSTNDDTDIVLSVVKDSNLRKEGINLLFTDDIDGQLLNSVKYVDFTDLNLFYLLLFDLIGHICDKPEILQMKKGFKQEVVSIEKSWQGNVASSSGLQQKALPNIKSNRFNIKFLTILVLTIILLISGLFYNYEEDIDIDQLNTQIAEYIIKISADNMSPNIDKENYNNFPKAAAIIKKFDNPEVRNQYTHYQTDAKKLLNVLYLMQSVAANYNYLHKGDEARKILLHAFNMIEQFIKTRNNIKVNFAKLENIEKYFELSSLDGLAEIYARLAYMMGRTYIYQDDIKSSEQYFLLSKYFGTKLKLYEGYGSTISGLNIIKLIKIKNAIDNNNAAKSIKLLHDLNKELHDMLEDNNAYVLDFIYTKKRSEHKVMIPSKDAINLCKIYIQLMKNYKNLVILDQKNASNYYNEILDILSAKNKDTLLKILNVEYINNRLKCTVYNCIANSALELYKSEQDISEIIKIITDNTDIKNDGNINVLLNLFAKSKLMSKYSDYTKADAYDGMAKIYQIMLKDEEMPKDKKVKINSLINQYKLERDRINKNLNRTGWRLSNV